MWNASGKPTCGCKNNYIRVLLSGSVLNQVYRLTGSENNNKNVKKTRSFLGLHFVVAGNDFESISGSFLLLFFVVSGFSWKSGDVRFDCAGASGSRVGPSRKPPKTEENATREPTRSMMSVFSRKVLKSNIKREAFGSRFRFEKAAKMWSNLTVT